MKLKLDMFNIMSLSLPMSRLYLINYLITFVYHIKLLCCLMQTVQPWINYSISLFILFLCIQSVEEVCGSNQ